MFYFSKFECFNSIAIIFECFEIFKFVWIWLLVADAIKMATKRKHHEMTLKVKYEILKELERLGLIKMLQTNSVFLVILLLLGRKKRKNLWTFSKFTTETTKSENWNIQKVKWSLLSWFASMRGNSISINGPIPLEKAYKLAKAISYNFTASNRWLRGWKER